MAVATYTDVGVALRRTISDPDEQEMLQYAGDLKGDMAAGRHQVHFTYKGIMQLASRPREKLLLRARLSIIYSALWGFGGTYNGTEKRRQFENFMRDTASSLYPDVDLCADYSLFDCVFNIQQPEIVIALQCNPLTNVPIINEGAPIKADQNSLYAQLTRDNANNNNADRLVFRTPASRAVDSTIRLLMQTGANVLLLGLKGCGKSMLIADILADLKTNSATPQDTRNHVMTHLVDVVNGTKRSEGIFAAMEILRHVLKEFGQTETIHDNFASFDQCWRAAGTALKVTITYTIECFSFKPIL